MSDVRSAPLVAHVIYGLGTGGLENGLVNILNRCPPERYRHVIICLTSAGSFANRITAPGVEVVQMHKRPGHDLRMYWRLLRLLRRLRPDILHTRNLAALEVQALGVFLPGTRRVHGEHGRDIFDLDGKNRKYTWFRKCMRLMVGHYIAVSRDLESWLVSSIGVSRKRVSQIYNGVDADSFSGGEAKTVFPDGFLPSDKLPVIIGTVGRLAEVKDQALILKAIDILLRDFPRDSLRCVIVGEGPMRSELESTIEKLGLNDVVWLAGESDNVAGFLNAMDIFVLPSLGEGISNTVLEAMAAGLPVVASDVGGNPELVEHDKTGLCFPVGDEIQFAGCLSTLISNPERRRNMGHVARQRTERDFDWNRTVASYLSVYDYVRRSRMLAANGKQRRFPDTGQGQVAGKQANKH